MNIISEFDLQVSTKTNPESDVSEADVTEADVTEADVTDPASEDQTTVNAVPDEQDGIQIDTSSVEPNSFSLRLY